MGQSIYWQNYFSMSIFRGNFFYRFDGLSPLLHMKVYLSTDKSDLSTKSLSKQASWTGSITQMCQPIISECHCEPPFLLFLGTVRLKPYQGRCGGVAISCYLELSCKTGDCFGNNRLATLAPARKCRCDMCTVCHVNPQIKARVRQGQALDCSHTHLKKRPQSPTALGNSK